MFKAKRILRHLPDKVYLQLMYFYHNKKLINFRQPKGFNEKLQWLKINDKKPIYSTMVDKFKVKQYVETIIGTDYIVKTYNTWSNAADIDFDSLPNKFVLKCNNDSGGIVICKDKSRINQDDCRKYLSERLKNNGYWYGREWPYKNVEPKIIAEEYLEVNDENDLGLIDYKIYCFNGTPKFLYVSQGLGENHANAQIAFLDLNWLPMQFKRNDFKAFNQIPAKPRNYEEMLELAKHLSKDTIFLRVDFYELNDHVYFSEFTFFPCSGYMKFDPPEWDNIVGSWLELPIKSKIK